MKFLTLPVDSQERKNFPMLSGVLRYFPAALAGIAKISKLGNDKHNPGQPMHHARGKSTDHGDCIIRHLTDTEDLLAAIERGESVTPEQALVEASQLAWRALAYAQELHEKFGAPLAPGAKLPAVLEPANDQTLEIGAKVRILQVDKQKVEEEVGFSSWMQQELGKVGIVTERVSGNKHISVPAYTVKTNGEVSEWAWPAWALEVVK